jgi:hypothetical protein
MIGTGASDVAACLGAIRERVPGASLEVRPGLADTIRGRIAVTIGAEFVISNETIATQQRALEWACRKALTRLEREGLQQFGVAIAEQSAGRDARLAVTTDRLATAQRTLDALQALADEPCENLTTGRCVDDPTRSVHAAYTAARYCAPCRILHIIDTEGTAS